VGAGEAGQMLAMQLQHRFPNTESAYEIVGFIDDDAGKQGMYVEGCRVLGTREDIVRLADAHNIDLIVVAMHNISGTNFRQILERCETTKARIKVTPNVFALMDAKQSQSDLRDVQPEDLLGRSLVSRHETVDLSPVMGKTILITGAAGSIGSELSRQLCSYQPVKLILLDSNESNLHDLVIELSARYPKIDLTAHLGDITLRESLVPIFRQHRPQVVFHAAAYKHVPLLQTFPQEAVRVNVGGTHNVAYLACEYGVERFVLISSDKAVNPTSVMGATKRICEMLIQAISQECNYSTLFTAVRFGNVLGSRGSVVPTFMRQINSGGPVTVTDPEMTRYFMSVQEAVNLVIHAACITQGNEIFLLKMGEVVKILDLAERMIRIRGMRPYKDIEIKFTGIRPGEKLHEQLYDGSAESATETSHPGIIQLNYPDKHYRPSELLAWVDCLLQRGVDNEKALDELRWGLTPSEQYAVENL
jgi:FlaA1/EpsC-like NDP-sugar epimerase